MTRAALASESGRRLIGGGMILVMAFALAATSLASVRHAVREGAVVNDHFRVDPVDQTLWVY